jgi:hypothetical protein
MTRKRSRGKQGKRRKEPKDRPAAGRAGSATARMVAERIAAAGPSYLEDNFIRILQGCASLRQEPEFANLYFEPRQTLEAAARHFLRFRRRLMRAARRGTEAAAPLYDDYRIAVMNDLDTPQFRRQLQRRLGQCMDRLKYGHDAEKIEMALVLSTLLSDDVSQLVKGKDALPLGVYGLATAIYEDSFDRAMEQTRDAREIIGDELYALWCAKHNREDLKAITAAVDQISAFEELAVRIETVPALVLAWQRQEQYLIEEFESQIIHSGLTLTPNPFTPDEVALAMDRMERRHLSKPWSLSRYSAVLAAANLARCIRETLDEIVSPQKIAETIELFKSVGQACLENDDDRLHALVPQIQAAICHLQSEQASSRNQVFGPIFLLSFVTALKDADALGPHWRRLFKRIERSRLLRRMGGTAEP